MPPSLRHPAIPEVGDSAAKPCLACGTLRERASAGWGTFTNFLAYKLEQKGGKLVEIDRWFPSSKLCSNCYHQIDGLSLDIREWTCPHCGTRHDRDGNAATNIRAEGIRILQADGTAVSAVRGEVRPKLGRKSKLSHSPLITETA